MITRKGCGFPWWLLILAVLPRMLSAQTAVTLSLTPTPFTFGAPVILNAAVTPASATGRVTFYDGVTVLGSRSLTAGAASLSTILLPAGSHKLRAYYAGDASDAAATSNLVTQAIAAQPSAGFAARSPLAASATTLLAVADFNGDGKTDFALRNAGSLVILLGDGAGNFQVVTTLGLTPVSAAAGDFNNDGFTDLAVA